MKIVVTNNAIEYSDGFMKLGTLKDVAETIGSIKVLVYHKSNEKQEDKVEYITKLKSRVKTLIYIRDKSACEQAIQIVVVGLGGKYIDDEFFLESGEELSSLVSNLSEITALVEMGGVNVVNDFFIRYLNDGKSDLNKAYLTLVKDAVTDMVTEYNNKQLEIIKMSETATDLFSNTLGVLSGVEEEREKLKTAVETLEKAKNDGSLFSNAGSSSSSSIYFYPRVNYLKERKILRIKEVGNFPFLTSFMMGYHFFLTKMKFVKAKLIFILPVGDAYTVQYKEQSWITQESCRSINPYHKDIVFTNMPSRDVLTKLLDDSGFDYFVVVDRTKQVVNAHLLNSKGPFRFAVSGKGALNAANIKPTTCFAGRDIPGILFSVKYIQDYPDSVSQRERRYLAEHQGSYNILYGLK